MQLDFEHKLELEKSLVSELRSKVERAEQHAADVDKRYRKLDNDFASFRLAQAQSPVVSVGDRVGDRVCGCNTHPPLPFP